MEDWLFNFAVYAWRLRLKLSKNCQPGSYASRLPPGGLAIRRWNHKENRHRLIYNNITIVVIVVLSSFFSVTSFRRMHLRAFGCDLQKLDR